MQYRIRAYRTALGRLMVEVPSTKAVEAEAAIDALAWEVNGSMSSAATAHYKHPVAKEAKAFNPRSKRKVTKD